MQHANSANHAGHALRPMRKALGWEVEDVARATQTPARPEGYSPSYIYELENGTKTSTRAVKTCTVVLARELIRRHEVAGIAS